jgi:excisionase family DNA binding protein
MPAANTRKPDLFLTLFEAADELKISDRSLRSLISAGEVRACRLGKRIVRIPRAEIDRLAGVGATGLLGMGVTVHENAKI